MADTDGGGGPGGGGCGAAVPPNVGALGAIAIEGVGAVSLSKEACKVRRKISKYCNCC